MAFTTTSYSILGLLAVRPFTAYELTKQMGRTLHHFWPRAESGIYREIKRLVDTGLVVTEAESVGRRSRTRYTITDEGRRAVAGWLATPQQPGFLESEGLVRLLLADHGTKADLLAALDRMDAEGVALHDQMILLSRAYVAGVGEYPERSHVNLLVARFLLDFSDLVTSFSSWAKDVVDSWPDTADRMPDEETFAHLRALIDRR